MKQTNSGRALLECGRKYEKLERKDQRTKLCSLIINEILEKNSDKTITTTKFVRLSLELSSLFPKISPSIFYIQYSRGNKFALKVNKGGALYQEYLKVRARFRREGILPPSTRGNSLNGKSKEPLDQVAQRREFPPVNEDVLGKFSSES